MADPAAPAVASFDPVEWTKRIDTLDRENTRLRTENFDLKTVATREANAAVIARGEVKPLKAELAKLRDLIEKSENLKELARLRIEVAALHKSIAETFKAQAIADTEAKQKLAALSARASKAESQFRSLEGTASMMASSRDNANAAAAALLVERDKALESASELGLQLAETEKELRALRVAEKDAAQKEKNAKAAEKKA